MNIVKLLFVICSNSATIVMCCRFADGEAYNAIIMPANIYYSDWSLSTIIVAC